MRNLLNLSLLVFITSISVETPLAATVYRWVDHNGVTSYSDTPPVRAETQAEELLIDLPDASVDPIVAKRREAMTSLLDKLASERKEQALVRSEQAAQTNTPQIVVVERDTPSYPFWFRPRHSRQFDRPGPQVERNSDRLPRNMRKPNWPGTVKRWGFD